MIETTTLDSWLADEYIISSHCGLHIASFIFIYVVSDDNLPQTLDSANNSADFKITSCHAATNLWRIRGCNEKSQVYSHESLSAPIEN